MQSLVEVGLRILFSPILLIFLEVLGPGKTTSIRNQSSKLEKILDHISNSFLRFLSARDQISEATRGNVAYVRRIFGMKLLEGCLDHDSKH